MEPWRALDAQNGGMEAQNGAPGVYTRTHVVADTHHLDEEQGPDTGICIIVKSCIWIRIKILRIRSTADRFLETLV
jgi:hypothetical protein